jgi:hypothetical protein
MERPFILGEIVAIYSFRIPELMVENVTDESGQPCHAFLCGYSIVKSGGNLPPAPEGMEWRMIHAIEDETNLHADIRAVLEEKGVWVGRIRVPDLGKEYVFREPTGRKVGFSHDPEGKDLPTGFRWFRTDEDLARTIHDMGEGNESAWPGFNPIDALREILQKEIYVLDLQVINEERNREVGNVDPIQAALDEVFRKK